jgi:subtilisin family serine protease
MSMLSLWKRNRPSTPVVSRPNPVGRLLVELLEDRTLPSATYVPNELLVQFRSQVGEDVRAEARAAFNATLKQQIHTAGMAASGKGVMERIALPDGLSPETAAKFMKSNANVLFAEPNWLCQPSDISDDTGYTDGSLWGMYSDDLPADIGPAGTTNEFGSQAEKAWNQGYTGSSSVYVGVIDTGIQITHPDLAANIWTNPFDAEDGVDNDGNGYVDDIHGWDFYSNDNSVYDSATNDRHGTHVAGTIGAAGGNADGVAGVNWNVTMISTKFIGAGGGPTSAAILALDYLTDLKVRHGINLVVTNNSWGGAGFSQGLLDAISRAASQGILFVAAAGNQTTNTDGAPFYPAAYDTTAGAGYDAVISVASIDSSGAKAGSSNYGAATVDLGAPGVDIYSTLPEDSYGSISGTSMASPHVAGAVALYAAANSSASAAQIRYALLNSTTATESLDGITVTGGRLNVDAFMQMPVSPTLSIDNQSMTEGNAGASTMTFTVTLSDTPTAPVTVHFATSSVTASAASDYVAVSGDLTFNPGDPLSQTITVTINGDATGEQNETFAVVLSGANTPIGDGYGTGAIVNDDAAALTVSNAFVVEGSRGKKTLVFTVSLPQPQSVNVTFSYATANGTAAAGSDYKSTSGTAIIRAGKSSATVKVTVFTDKVAESDETVLLNISSAVNATIADSQGIGTIVNDDGATGASAARTALINSTLISDLSNLIAAVNDLGLKSGVANALISQLRAAQNSISRGYTKAAGNQLGATLNSVAALTKSRQLSAELAEPFVDELTGILSTLA